MRRLRCLGWLGVSILGVSMATLASWGQSSPKSEVVPVTTDWSHQHVIFSQPATAKQAKRVLHDPRYVRQQHRQLPASLSETEAGLKAELSAQNQIVNHDWLQDLGTNASLGPTNYPAKYSLTTSTANCAGAAQPDFVVYSTGLDGLATQASIAAFDNLYSGCSGTVPMVYWAYNTGAPVVTSPVFSRDGKQLAFMQRPLGTGQGVFVLLKWAASTTETIGSPSPVPVVSPAAYVTCIAPCRIRIPLVDAGSAADNTNSSVFYDYTNDAAYVGDASGYLHKFTPVFLGIPKEVTTGGWPVQVNPGAPTALTSPVYDSGSGNVFVADVGGFLYKVSSLTAVTTSGQLDFSSAEGGAGFAQGPIVDSTAGTVYAFASSDGSASCFGGADCAAVYQLTVSFADGDTGSEAVVGSSTFSGTAPEPIYLGAFDSMYLNSANPPTGNLYVCGNTGGPPIFYQVAIQAGAMNGLGTAGPVLSNSTTPCSPVDDVMNPNATGGATEWMFASVETGGISTACAAGGCLFNFKDTPWKPSTAYSVGQEILDNHFQIQVVSVAGTSGAAAPGWSTIIGHSTTDGTVHWLDQGPQSAVTLAAWKPNHAYALHAKILDPNNNVEFVTTAGTSGGSIPGFNMTAGGVTSDGATLKWTNLGALGTAVAPEAGGTSGIIIDNIVGSGTLAGASQIYFSTLSDQVCGTSGTGGCAVQASQSGLQ